MNDFLSLQVPVINWSKFNTSIPENLLKEIHNDNEEKITKCNKIIEDVDSRKRHHWTVEEQKRLEELLIEYPPEDVELQRFRKIANALGNRTVQQVSSRVQKYFLKLHSMGLPIPGRIPKSILKKVCDVYLRINSLNDLLGSFMFRNRTNINGTIIIYLDRRHFSQN